MPLPANFSKPTPDPTKDRILLTTHGLAKLSETHDETVMRAVAKNVISPDAWADLNGVLCPLFTPASAIVLIGLRAPLPHDPNPQKL